MHTIGSSNRKSSQAEQPNRWQSYFGEEEQDLLLACMCAMPDEFARVGSLVKPQYMWGLTASRTCGYLQEYTQQYGHYPTLEALRAYVHLTLGRGKEEVTKEIAAYIEKLVKIDTRDWQLMLDASRLFCLERAAVMAIEQSALQVKAGKVEEGLEPIFARITAAMSAVLDDEGPKDCATCPSAPVPEILIEDLLHVGSKLVLGGSSKARKTWSLLDLGASVATGSKFWNRSCTRAPVLYVNFELAESFFQQRCLAVLEAKGVKFDPGFFHHWCLRGRLMSPETFIASAVHRVKALKAKLLIVDPVYKLLLGDGKRRMDENSAGDIAVVLAGLERIAVEAGAAIAFGAHFSKGAQEGKEHMDRISGSGVFARDPDTILTMTRPKDGPEGVYAIEATLRNLPPMMPFCIRWDYPLFRITSDDAEELLTREKVTDAQLLVCLPMDGVGVMKSSDWEAKSGLSRSRFDARRKKLLEAGKIVGGRDGYAQKLDLSLPKPGKPNVLSARQDINHEN